MRLVQDELQRPHEAVWYMPELVPEVPSLLEAAGKIKIVPTFVFPFDHVVTIVVTLNEPAKVIDWRKRRGNGIAINRDSSHWHTGRIGGHIRKLPRVGDLEVELVIDLSVKSWNYPEEVTFDTMREELRRLAKAMNKEWYYHFI